jgi:hypothetical protein
MMPSNHYEIHSKLKEKEKEIYDLKKAVNYQRI